MAKKLYLGYDPEEVTFDRCNSERRPSDLHAPVSGKSGEFESEIGAFAETEIAVIIERDLPSLADGMARVIEKKIMEIVDARINQWRSGQIPTLNEMGAQIEVDCTEKHLSALLSEDADYSEAIDGWLIGEVGRDVALRLKAISEKYGLKMEAEQLNILRADAFDPEGRRGERFEDMSDAVSKALCLISGVISSTVLPNVFKIILGHISALTMDIAASLLALLLLLPGWGYACLIVAGGYMVFRAIRAGNASSRQILISRLQDVNLPQRARALLRDKKLRQKLEDANLADSIRQSVVSAENAPGIVCSIREKLGELTLKRIEDIKYLVGSR